MVEKPRRSPRERLVKITFPVLDGESSIETESMWARVGASGGYVLDNIPFFVPGVALGDEVAAELHDHRLWATEMLVDSGNITVWVLTSPFVSPGAGKILESLARTLNGFGAGCELGLDNEVMAVNIGPHMSIAEIGSALDAAEREGWISWAHGKWERWWEIDVP